MILFQIDNNDRPFMHDLLVQHFDFQGFCNSLREKYPKIESTRFKRLSTQNASLNTDLFKSLLLFVKEFLGEHFPHHFAVGNEMFDAFEDADDSFFWDTIIAIYTQLIYDQSKSTTMRSFYAKNLSKYGIKYDSYTDYFKSHIFDQPMGEYLNIHPINPEKSHPRRYIRDCFPIQQYVLIHSFSKSPYCKSPSSNTIDNLFKMQEYIESDLLGSDGVYNDSVIYHFTEIVQNICTTISKNISESNKKSFLYVNPMERKLDDQLTAYIVEQAYHYEIFSQIASDTDVVDSFKTLRTCDNQLYRKNFERMKTEKKRAYAEGMTQPEIVAFYSDDEERKEIKDFTHKVDSFQKLLDTISDIACISAVLTRPYIGAYRLNRRSWVPRNRKFPIISPDRYNPIIYMANVYIPLVQEFYLQVLLWLFPAPDSKIELHMFLKQLLIENLEEWKINNATLGNLGSTEGKILGLLFEISRTKHRTVNAIQREYSRLDFSKRIWSSQ